MANDLDLADSVILAGRQDNVYPFMARAKALVLCSRYEGWPNVLVEAMACGCPVVATDRSKVRSPFTKHSRNQGLTIISIEYILNNKTDQNIFIQTG